MLIKSIWAQDRNRILGDGQKMLWHVPADFKHFKASTLGHPIIMGRKSFEALGKRPLPGRCNLVLTSDPHYEALGAQIASCLEAALEQCRSAGSEIAWITGGAGLYQQAMAIADELVITELDLDLLASAQESSMIKSPEKPAISPEIKPKLVYAPLISNAVWEVDTTRSDRDFRPQSGDAPWRVIYYQRRLTPLNTSAYR